MSSKSQGSLEYLIIIATVLAISAVVVMFITNTFGSQREQASISKCKQAAAECRSDKLLDSSASCSQCKSACDSDNLPNDAVNLCKEGEVTNISG